MGRPKGSGVKLLRDRLRAQTLIQDKNECWLFQGYINPKGYGQLGKENNGTRNPGSVLAHRVAYELEYGIIPEGITIDHMCHTSECPNRNKDCQHRRCVNPKHLALATRAENTSRTSVCAERTHCPEGHEYTEENTIIDKTSRGNPTRKCRECKNSRRRKIHIIACQVCGTEVKDGNGKRKYCSNSCKSKARRSSEKGLIVN